MLFNYKKDIVFGKVKYFTNNSICGEIYVLGIYMDKSEFKRFSQKEANENFPHSGKVFISDNTVLKQNGIEDGDYIEFSTIKNQPTNHVDFHESTLNLLTPINKICPKIISLSLLHKEHSESKYTINLDTIDLTKWSGYIFDESKNILYEKIQNNPVTGVDAFRGKAINGINFDLYVSPDYIIEENKCIYTSKYFNPIFCEENICDTIDLSNISQKIDWLKQQIRELNKFSEKEITYFNKTLNLIKETDYFDNTNLVKSRISTIQNTLESITFSDNEIKTLINKKSSIGSHLISQIIEEKNKYCKELFEEIEKDTKKKREQYNKALTDLQLKNDQLNKSNTKLEKVKEQLNSEISILDSNKELIYITIKALIENSSSLSTKEGNEENNTSIDFFYDIVKYDSNFEMVENENIEESLYKYTKFDQLAHIIKNKLSFIPSISWTYSLAKHLGNSEVLNMSVEYDWLHYSDFVNHGLHKFISECKKSPKKFFFLHFENLNIIPMDCGFNSIYKVFAKEKPFFNGTLLEVPDNLFVTATLISTKNDNTTGNSIPENYRKLFKGIGCPMNNMGIMLNEVKNEYKFSYDEEFKNLISKMKINNSEEYYEY